MTAYECISNFLDTFEDNVAMAGQQLKLNIQINSIPMSESLSAIENHKIELRSAVKRCANKFMINTFMVVLLGVIGTLVMRKEGANSFYMWVYWTVLLVLFIKHCLDWFNISKKCSNTIDFLQRQMQEIYF